MPKHMSIALPEAIMNNIAALQSGQRYSLPIAIYPPVSRVFPLKPRKSNKLLPNGILIGVAASASGKEHSVLYGESPSRLSAHLFVLN